MGGFEGGDEGGFWDTDAIDTLIKKQNTATPQVTKVKILIENSTYTLSSDSTISIVPQNCKTFTIEGCENIVQESNTIYKTYKTLLSLTCDSDIEDFFTEHKVVVNSYTPASSASSFLLLIKELCNLVLSENELQTIKEAAI